MTTTASNQAPAAPVAFDCYSVNGEEYRKGGMADALDEMDAVRDGADGESLNGRTYWLGVTTTPVPSDFFSLDRLIEDMQERAYDEHGEFAEDFLTDLSVEKAKELESLVTTWLDANATVSFFGVRDMTEFAITEQDLKDHDHE